MGKQELKITFDEYYQELWGERWKGLMESLLLPGRTIPYKEGLVKPYMMDGASVLAASLLKLPAGGIILDACAAPGGKSLVLASRMGPDTQLLCNELSSERRRRLVNVLDEHLDKETRQRVTVSGFDTARAGSRRSEWNRFDAILLDAPCSSERHVIQSPKALAEWSPARPRSLSQRQWSLLSAAFLLLKPGGSLVYATCALTPEENDGPVSRLLSKYSGQIELDEAGTDEALSDAAGTDEALLRLGEKTQYGRLILPDTTQGDAAGTDAAGGMGPMYMARFYKTQFAE